MKKLYEDEEKERIEKLRLEKGPVQSINTLLRKTILLKVDRVFGTDEETKTKFEEAKHFSMRRKRFFNNKKSQLELSYVNRMVESIDKFTPSKI